MKKMFTTLIAGTLFFCAMGLAAKDDAKDDMWTSDFEAAKKEAAERGVPIFMYFTGSDWCGWCMKLTKEVLSQKEFEKYAKENLVLFKADFPSKTKLDEKTAKQNKELAQKYKIEGYPTVVLADETGKEIARTGYRDGGAKEYVKHLKSELKSYKPKKKDKADTKPAEAKPATEKPAEEKAE